MSTSYQKTVKNQDEVEIDVGRLFGAVWHNFVFVIFGILAGGVIALVLTVFLIHPTYRASFSSYVNNHSASDVASTLTNGDTTAAQSLAYTYAKIISSQSVLKEAAQKTGLDYPYEDGLGRFVQTSVEDNTQLVSVDVTMGNAEEAYKLAKAIEEVAPSYVSNVVEGSSMKIVAQAQMPTHRYSPHIKKNVAIGAVLGFLLMVLFYVVRELMDKRVKNAEDLEELFDVPVIGTIPDILSAGNKRSKYYGRYGQKYETYYTAKAAYKEGNHYDWKAKTEKTHRR